MAHSPNQLSNNRHDADRYAKSAENAETVIVPGRSESRGRFERWLKKLALPLGIVTAWMTGGEEALANTPVGWQGPEQKITTPGIQGYNTYLADYDDQTNILYFVKLSSVGGNSYSEIYSCGMNIDAINCDSPAPTPVPGANSNTKQEGEFKRGKDAQGNWIAVVISNQDHISGKAYYGSFDKVTNTMGAWTPIPGGINSDLYEVGSPVFNEKLDTLFLSTFLYDPPSGTSSEITYKASMNNWNAGWTPTPNCQDPSKITYLSYLDDTNGFGYAGILQGQQQPDDLSIFLNYIQYDAVTKNCFGPFVDVNFISGSYPLNYQWAYTMNAHITAQDTGIFPKGTAIFFSNSGGSPSAQGIKWVAPLNNNGSTSASSSSSTASGAGGNGQGGMGAGGIGGNGGSPETASSGTGGAAGGSGSGGMGGTGGLENAGGAAAVSSSTNVSSSAETGTGGTGIVGSGGNGGNMETTGGFGGIGGNPETSTSSASNQGGLGGMEAVASSGANSAGGAGGTLEAATGSGTEKLDGTQPGGCGCEIPNNNPEDINASMALAIAAALGLAARRKPRVGPQKLAA